MNTMLKMKILKIKWITIFFLLMNTITVAITCMNPPFKSNQHVVGEKISWRVNETVEIECDDGYTFQASYPQTRFTCGNDEKWLGKIPECHGCFNDIIEIIFVVDGSGSIGFINFSTVRDWLINVTKALSEDFGETVRTEVLQYSNKDRSPDRIPIEDSNKFEIPYTLNEDLSIDAKIERIRNMKYLNSQTYTYFALRRAMEVEFPRSDFYQTSKKIIVVLTDGAATDRAFLPQWYQKYKDIVTSFAVGVGDFNNFIGDLNTIANGGTSSDRVLKVENFEALLDVITNLTSEITNMASTEGCINNTIEIIFVVDGSVSIGFINFIKVRDWLVNVTEALYDKFGETVRTEVLQYSNKDRSRDRVSIEDSTKFEIPYTLNEVLSIDTKTDRIRNMKYLNSFTYTYYALRRTMEVEFPRSDCYETSEKIIVVLTDGAANDKVFLPQWYKEYKDTVTSFAVGVGDFNNFSGDLNTIANGGTSSDRVLRVDNFEALLDVITIITSEITNLTSTEEE